MSPCHRLWSCLVVVPLFFGFGCDKAGESQNESELAPRVVTTEVQRREAVDAVTLLGELHGSEEVRVFSPLPERIRRLHVREGSSVQAGDPIATLFSDLQRSGVSQASAALAAAEAARDQLRTELARTERLANQGAIPESQLTALRAQLRTSAAQVDQLRAARRSASSQQDRTVVRAPVAGTIALLSVSEGDMAAPTMPLCTVVELESLVLKLRVTERDYLRIQVGMSVRLHPLAVQEVEREGRVVRISPILDPLTRTALVEVEVTNADRALRPGMVAEASIVLRRRENIVLVPSSALVLSSRTQNDREAYVFLTEEGTARRHAVRLGRRYGTTVEVVEGLEGGEPLILEGQHLLRDGAAVRVTEDDVEDAT